MTKEDLKQISDLMDVKFEAMEAKFDAKFETMEAKFDAKFETMEAKFDAEFEAMDDKFTSEFKATNNRFESKFDKTNKELAELRKICLRLDKGQEDMKKDIKDLKKAQVITDQKISSIQDSINTLDGKVDNLRVDFDIMNEEVSAVKDWISEHSEKKYNS